MVHCCSCLGGPAVAPKACRGRTLGLLGDLRDDGLQPNSADSSELSPGSSEAWWSIYLIGPKGPKDPNVEYGGFGY